MLTCSRFLKSRSEEGIPGSPRKSQKRGEKDQGTLRAPGGFPLALFRFAWTSRPSFWLSPGFHGTPSLRGPSDQSLLKALPGNNDLVLEPFLGDTLAKASGRHFLVRTILF